MKKVIGKFLLWAFRWQSVPYGMSHRKAVVVMAPHTSTWDIYVGLAFAFATDVPLSWVGKHTLFEGFFGRILTSTCYRLEARRSSHASVPGVVAP